MNKLTFIVFLFTMAFSSLSQAQTAPIDDNGLAIGGYDVVAYFSGEAKKGTKNHMVKHKDATYYFSTKENRDAFQKSPEQYLPQFGGYCAWGVAAKEAKFPINPETFDIVDGKLYLFYNGPHEGKNLNTLLPWNTETTDLLKSGHMNWGKMDKS